MCRFQYTILKFKMDQAKKNMVIDWGRLCLILAKPTLFLTTSNAII